MRLSAAIGRFDAQLHADGKSPLTRQAYLRDLRAFERWFGNGVQLSTITADDVARFLTSETFTHTTSGRSKKTISLNRSKSALRSFFQFLVDAGYLTGNPARLVRMGRCSRHVPAYLSRSEIHTLLRFLEKANTSIAKRDRLMILVMLSTGIRLGSLVALNIGDIDLGHSTLRVRGKNGTENAVFLSRPLKKLLKNHVAHRATHKDEPLFLSNRGRRIGVRQVELRLAHWLHIAGITRRCSVHSLRHTFATCLYEETGDLRLVQRALGHRRITTTDIYAHMSDSRLRRAVQQLDLLG